MILLQIPKAESFDIPEGWFRAILRDVGERDKLGKAGFERVVRFVFELTSLPDTHTTFKAGRNYRLSDPAELLGELQTWLGSALLSLVRRDGQLDLQALEGREADIEIVHIFNDHYDQPYCHVRAIRPAGTIVKHSAR